MSVYIDEDLIWTGPVTRRPDGSYVVTVGGHPYHAPNEGEFAELWAQIDAHAREHPDEVTEEELPPPPTLEEVKAQAAAALREKRKAVEYGGFELNGQTWDSAEKDELRLNSISKIFESGVAEYPGWKIAEGVYITLTPALLQQASFALMRHYGNAFAVEAAKLGEINALETVADVRAWLETNLNQGW